MDIVKYIICAAVVVLILAGFVIGMIRNRKIRRNGIEAQGVISRVEERYESDGESGSYTFIYYVNYTTREGKTIEARLGKMTQAHFDVGQTIRVKYLPKSRSMSCRSNKVSDCIAAGSENTDSFPVAYLSENKNF